MRHERRLSPAVVTARLAHAVVAVLALALLATACSTDFLYRNASGDDTAPVVDRAAASAALIATYLEGLEHLLAAPPAEQAEIAAAARHDYELAPTPDHQLRYALILATPGHAATDQTGAQRMLRELTAAPAALQPPERALAFLEQQKLDAQLTLAAENQRLQSDATRMDRDKTNALSKRLQTEVEENARLRKELNAAQAKLDAISDIERSLSERKPSAESRSR